MTAPDGRSDHRTRHSEVANTQNVANDNGTDFLMESSSLAHCVHVVAGRVRLYSSRTAGAVERGQTSMFGGGLNDEVEERHTYLRRTYVFVETERDTAPG